MPLKDVTCLITSVRGGSKLFHYLLDSHPQIVCFPRTLQFDAFWDLIKDNNKSFETLADIFIEQYPRFFSGEIWKDYNPLDRADLLGEQSDETFLVDKILFKNYLIELSKLDVEISSKSVFINLHLAYYKASRRDLPNNYTILYHIHALKNIKSLRFCVNDFGLDKTKLIFSTKHPLRGMNSILEWMDNVGTKIQNQPAQLFYYQDEIYLGLSEIKREFPEIDIKILLLECLIKDKHKYIANLAQWMDISWNNSLLKPTIHGKLWWGNAKIKKKGIDKNIDKFKPAGFLEKKDWEFIKATFPLRMIDYGYHNKDDEKIKIFFLIRFVLILLPTHYEYTLIVKYSKRLLFSFKSLTNKPITYLNNNIKFIVRWFYYYIKRIYLLLTLYK